MCSIRRLLCVVITLLPASVLAFNLTLPIGAKPASVSDFDINAYYSQYATAAYCSQNTQGSLGSKINCPNGQCNDASNSIIVEKFETTRTRTAGFVAVDKKRKLIIVAFRGANDFGQFLTLLTTAITQSNATDLCKGCLVSAPFLDGYSEVSKIVLDAVSKAAQQNPGFKVVTVGHSYGGAIAHLAALDVRRMSPSLQVDLATYGSPRVGNPTFAATLNNQNNQKRLDGTPYGRNIRVVLTGDVIDNIPPANVHQYLVFGPTLLYNHTTPYLFLGNPSGTRPKTTDLFTVPAPDVDIALGTLTQQVQAHRWYFNGISFCDTLPPPGTFPPPNGVLVAGMESDELKKDVEALEQFYVLNNLTVPLTYYK